jgi:hypothetical protein
MKEKYIVVKCCSLDGLCEDVNLKLSQGYEVTGGVFKDDLTDVFCQSMLLKNADVLCEFSEKPKVIKSSPEVEELKGLMTEYKEHIALDIIPKSADRFSQ